MVHMHESADVAADAVIGDGTYVWANVQIRPGARVGRSCVVGRHVFVDLDVHVGDNVKIQNNAALYEGVRVEDGAFIGPYVIFTNDKVPRAINPDGTLKSKEDWQLGTTTVRYGASLGAGLCRRDRRDHRPMVNGGIRRGRDSRRARSRCRWWGTLPGSSAM